MKTIEVTDEMYDFLMNLSKELNTQDHRCTAMPYYFTVRETKEIPAHNGNGTEVMYSSEHEIELRTEHEKREWIKENQEYFIDTIYHEESLNLEFEDLWTIDQMLLEVDFDRFYVDTDYTYENCFLTSKACDEHIRINKHNLKEPVNYLKHAYRNLEMEQLLKFLCSLTGGEIHR